MLDNIGEWSAMELKRFITSQIIADPKANPPKKELPEAFASGELPVWDGNEWTTTLTVPIPTAAIADDAITSAKVLDGSLVASDLATGVFMRLLVAGTDRKVMFGSGTCTFNGANDFSATNVTVTHGLGATPLCVLSTFSQSVGLTKYPVVQVFSVGGTQFTVGVNTSDSQVPANGSTAGVYYLAIA